MSQHAVRIARDHCLAPERVDAPIYGGRYRSLFPELPALEVDEAALHALGRPGGPCDLGIDFPDDADAHVAAVWPFFGQFVAHDVTADRSPVTHRADADRIRNSRNDVHLFTSQMAVAFIKLHNRLVDRLREDGIAEDVLFEDARRAATWHYQHVIVREFLPSLIGAQLTTDLLEGGPRLYRIDRDPYIPFEFADAAYRYGHSQIRARYQVNARFGPLPVFPDLMGFGRVSPERMVDWTLQIDVPGHPAAQRAKRIDSRLPPALIALPTQAPARSRAPTTRLWPTVTCSAAKPWAWPPARPSPATSSCRR